MGIGSRVRARLRALGGPGAAARPPAAGQRRRRDAGLAWPAAEIGVVLLTAIVTAVVLHLAIVNSGFSAVSAAAGGVGLVWAAALIALAVAAHVVQRRATGTARPRMIVAVLAGVAAGLVMAPLMAGLNGTHQPPNTIFGGDMAFRTESVTRFATTWQLHDYTFKGLHAFYPPAWFWLAGRAADVFGVTAWHMVKPATIVTMGMALVCSYGLWRVVFRPAGALSAAVGSLLVLPAQTGTNVFATQAWYSPYSCFVAVTGVAWVVATSSAIRRGETRGRLALLAVAGAVLALMYYLLFIVAVVVLLALILVRREGRRSALIRLGGVIGAVAVLTAVFWIPLLASLAGGAASQGHYVNQRFLHVYVGIGGPAALSVLAAVAIVGLVLTFRSRATMAIAALLAGTVLYQLLSVATLTFFHSQLQPHRAVTMMWAAYGAALPVVLESLGSGEALRSRVSPGALRAVTAVVAAVAIAATFALGAEQGSDLAGGAFSRAAHNRRVPLVQINGMSHFITTTIGKRPRELTLLTGDWRILITKPYFGFFPLSARYAHPEADLPGRVAAARAAAACRDPACTTRALTDSRFGRVDALILARLPGGFRATTQIDGVPLPQRVVILFGRNAFDPAVWARRAFGPYTVFARRPS
jgi:galactan 5-O-arabinofuranosyltransferase